MGQISVRDAQIYARKLCFGHDHAIGKAHGHVMAMARPLEVVAQVGLDTKVRGVF